MCFIILFTFYYFFFFFFFSSRRRHTRSLCDWSSDVCSSDLLGTPDRPGVAEALPADAALAAREIRGSDLLLRIRRHAAAVRGLPQRFRPPPRELTRARGPTSASPPVPPAARASGTHDRGAEL